MATPKTPTTYGVREIGAALNSAATMAMKANSLKNAEPSRSRYLRNFVWAITKTLMDESERQNITPEELTMALASSALFVHVMKVQKIGQNLTAFTMLAREMVNDEEAQ